MALKKNIKIPEKDGNLAELIGIILGDGNLHSTQNRITITGSIEDQFYYNSRVVPLFNTLFHVIPRFSFRKDKNACDLVLEDKNIFNKITEIGLVRGNKLNATIPSFLLDNECLMKHFLRGLFDTDGSIKFSKQTKKVNYYPRIRICLKESTFAKRIGVILNSLDFSFSKWLDLRSLNPIIYYEISGLEMLNKWVKDIGFGNMVHGSKYLFWKKFGFHKLGSSLEERMNKMGLPLSNYLIINCPKI